MGKKSKRRNRTGARLVPTRATVEEEVQEEPSPNDDECCEYCGNTPGAGTLKECGRCGAVAYCSKQCQAADWKKHGKSCRFRAQEREIVNRINALNDKYMKDPKVRALIESYKEMEREQMGVEIPAFHSAQIQFRLKEVGDYMIASREIEAIEERYKDAEPDILARKLVKTLAANYDRSSIQLFVYGLLYKNVEAWNACFTNDALRTKFFTVLEKIMDNDVEKLNSIPLNAAEDDLAVAPPSLFVIERIPFYRAEGIPYDESEGTLCTTGALYLQVIEDRAESYYSTFWEKYLELSVATSIIIKNDARTPESLGLDSISDLEEMGCTQQDLVDMTFRLERLLRDCWCSTSFCFGKEAVACAVLQSCDGVEVLDATSTRLASLVKLLAVDGRKIHKFKHFFYLAAALLVVHAGRTKKEGMISSTVLMKDFEDGLSERRFYFFRKIVLPYAEQILAGQVDTFSFDPYMAERPELRSLL